jgi:hypothetical protein
MQTQYVSPQIEQIMGCTPEAFIAEPELWLDLIVDEQQRACAAIPVSERNVDRQWLLADAMRGCPPARRGS